MVKLLEVRDFAKGGLNTDLPSWDLPSNFLTNIRNVRLYGKKLAPFGGYSVWTDLPVNIEPGFIMPAGAVSDDFWLIAGLNNVYAYDGNTFFNISSSGGYVSINDESLWQGSILSDIALLNNVQGYPEYWPDKNGAVLLEPLPWDATNTWEDLGQQAKVIRSHKQFLFALNLVDGGVEIKDGVRWSSPADINSIPETWDPLDITNFAGITQLGGTGGDIVDGRTLRDSFVVYREKGISVFDYVGGQFVWSIRHLSESHGLLSPNAIIEVKGSHFFMSDGDILYNDGNTIKSLTHNRIKKQLINSIDSENYKNSYAVRNTANSEAWFCVPETGFTFPNIAFVYNWKDDTWSIRDIPVSEHASYGSQVTAGLSWDTVEGSWNNSNITWAQTGTTPVSETIISAALVDGTYKLLLLDEPINSVLSPFSTMVERVGFPIEGQDYITTITRVYPHIAGAGKVFIQMGSQSYVGDAVRWEQAVEFNPQTDRQVDVRTTGALHCFRVYTEESSDPWELSGMDIEYVTAGKR